MKWERHGEGSKVYMSTEYKAWRNMRQRCNAPTHDSYELYGGRGIRVCDRWDSYLNFLADMGRKPDPAMTLDRIDSNGNYEPVNCRWATAMGQASNKRNNVFLTLNGMSRTISEWSRITGILKSVLSNRRRAGWSDYKALTTFPLYPYARCAKVKNDTGRKP